MLVPGSSFVYRVSLIQLSTSQSTSPINVSKPVPHRFGVHSRAMGFRPFVVRHWSGSGLTSLSFPRTPLPTQLNGNYLPTSVGT